MKKKLFLSLGSIAAILLLSSVISILEYRRMSDYVSDQIASNIRSINVLQKLAALTDSYNLKMLTVIGEEEMKYVPDFNQDYFLEQYDTLRMSFTNTEALPAADSVLYSYSAYMMTSLELLDVMESDFIDSREWYFSRLQPRFQKFKDDMEVLSNLIYEELKMNSEDFHTGFYRSIIPGVVSVGAGLMLVFLLMYYIMSYYVRPIYKMSDGIDDYRTSSRRYVNTIDSEDQLSNINDGIVELIDENIQLKKRIRALRGGMNFMNQDNNTES